MVTENSVNIDESLILKRAVHQQDRKALAVLHAKYYPHMKRYIASRINSVTDAEDLAQNVFVELCKGNARYDGRGSVQGYLFGIVRNTIGRYRRCKQNQPQTIHMDSIGETAAFWETQQHQDPVGQISAQELKEAIEDALAQLPHKAQQALKLRFIEGLTPREAAKRAGCSVYALYQRLYYAFGKLKKLKDSVAVDKKLSDIE